VNGNCTGLGIRIIMPMIGGTCIYDGTFQPNGTIIGTRVCHGFPLDAAAPEPPPPGDIWDADKET
jgi:hypothetical protein